DATSVCYPPSDESATIRAVRGACDYRRRRTGITIACSGRAPRDRPSIIVFNAGALALPLRAALDSFSALHGYGVSQENAGSVETIRKISDLGRVPDIVAVADTALFARLIPGRLTG